MSDRTVAIRVLADLNTARQLAQEVSDLLSDAIHHERAARAALRKAGMLTADLEAEASLDAIGEAKAGLRRVETLLSSAVLGLGREVAAPTAVALRRIV